MSEKIAFPAKILFKRNKEGLQVRCLIYAFAESCHIAPRLPWLPIRGTEHVGECRPGLRAATSSRHIWPNETAPRFEFVRE